MQKQAANKKIVAVLCAAAVVAAAVVILILNQKEESFRSILVYELEGSAVIDRTDIGSIDAAPNLYLESGDCVSVHTDSMMRMKLDNDKYITAEADTVFSLEAEGDEHDSRTRIRLEQGALTNEIQNPLSGESLYETSTPNSVMAVRGTIYRAELTDDGADGQDMRLCCFEGTVAAKPVLPDGAYGEEVLVPAGSELTVYSDGTVSDLADIEYASLSGQALKTLRGLLDNGESIKGISLEELEQITQDGDRQDAVSEPAGDVQEPAAADEQDETEQDTEEKDTKSGQNTGGQSASSRRKNDNKNTDQGGGSPAGDTGSKPAKPKEPSPSSGGSSNTGDSGNADGGNGQGSGNGGDNGKDKDPGGGSGSKQPSKEVVYTVTYQYQDSVFATQSVRKGKKASVPTLAPAAEGSWDFDFNTKINADTVIRWKAGN